MLLNLIRRYGAFTVRVIVTALGILASVAMTAIVNIFLTGRISAVDITVSAVIPAILGWVTVGIFLDLLQRLQRTEDELTLLAHEDSLTHLLNRRRFLELAALEWDRAQRLQLPLTVLVLDVDHFKRINDTYGHPAGDAVLQHLSEILRRELRRYDLIARYGGEEFAVLLPGADAAQGQTTAQRLLATLADSPLAWPQADIAFTVSIGLTPSSPDCPGLESLLIAADNALYRAKQAGRNRVAAARCGQSSHPEPIAAGIPAS